MLKWSEIKAIKTTLARSSLIGTIIGLLPGAGATIAAFIGYNKAKRFLKIKRNLVRALMREWLLVRQQIMG